MLIKNEWKSGTQHNCTQILHFFTQPIFVHVFTFTQDILTNLLFGYTHIIWLFKNSLQIASHTCCIMVQPDTNALKLFEENLRITDVDGKWMKVRHTTQLYTNLTFSHSTHICTCSHIHTGHSHKSVVWLHTYHMVIQKLSSNSLFHMLYNGSTRY